MTFSLDLSKPLGRLGLVVNVLALTVLFYALSAGSFRYMTETLPHAAVAHKTEEIARNAEEAAFAKAKAAAKGKAIDEKAVQAQAKVAAEAEIKKQEKEIHHHAFGLWAPFSIFLLILSALFFAGFLSVYVQRRANDGGLKGLWLFVNHLGAWAFAGYVAFYPLLAEHDLRRVWAPAFIAGLVLLLPVLFAGEGHAEHDDHGHDHDHGHAH